MNVSVERTENRTWRGLLWGLARLYRLSRDRLNRPLYALYERRLAREVANQPVPRHLGLILDGNRRFARAIGLDARRGHEFGVQKLHQVLDWCAETGIAHVTLFVFSNDNFSRKAEEVEYLLNLFVRESANLVESPKLQAHGIRIRVIGQRHRLPERVVRAIDDLETRTRDNTGLSLNIAMAYDGREEIADAVRGLLGDLTEQGLSLETAIQRVSVDNIGRHLYMAGLPDPDFIIRTSGELRLSGFCLWQSAYSEYYFCEALWPDFRRIDFLRSIRSYQSRQRRFGR